MVFLSSSFNAEEPPAFLVVLVFLGLCWYAGWICTKYREAKEALASAQKKLDEANTVSKENDIKRLQIKRESDLLNSRQELFRVTIEETRQSRPALAEIYADAQYDIDIYAAIKLQQKKRPALKAADEIKQIAAEKRQLIQQNKVLQHQIDFYENLFPWLEDFKELSINEATEYVGNSSNEEYDAVKKWLSPEEYDKLNSADKYQLALDRWKTRKKSAWDIGIDFERYIGYQLEQRGYKVKYLGATLGLEDMGRDLMATKDGVSLVIQCKRWAKEKTIHEKHICQLYGSVAVLATQNPNRKFKGVFITTTTLSDVAKMFAEYSNIAYVENCGILDYPMIKCNISKTGEKIYHLPFDQQYDKAEISKKPGAFYAWTTKEAEAAGFRRAYRWHPDNV